MACSLLECKKPVNAETGKVEVRAYQVTASQRADLKVIMIVHVFIPNIQILASVPIPKLIYFMYVYVCKLIILS